MSDAEFARRMMNVRKRPTCCHACATPWQRASFAIPCKKCGSATCPHASNHVSSCVGKP